MSKSNVWVGVIINTVISMVIGTAAGCLSKWFIGVAVYFAVSMSLNVWLIEREIRMES